MNLTALCHGCKHQHSLAGPPEGAVQRWLNWGVRHSGHDIELVTSRPDWAKYKHNADIKIAYAASATITCGVASLATSATFVAGRESTVISNATNLYVDALLSGQVTVGTTPTIDTQIRIYVFAARDDTPTYPDVMDGTDSAETLTSVGVGAGFLKLAKVLDVDATTSDRGYDFGPVSVAQLFGGSLPQRWSLFVTHNTGVNLNTTAGNHVFKFDGITYTVV